MESLFITLIPVFITNEFLYVYVSKNPSIDNNHVAKMILVLPAYRNVINLMIFHSLIPWHYL